MKHALLILLCAFSALGQEMHSASENYATDLIGTPDHRIDTWGDSGYQQWSIVFYPPPGYRVRILHVFGNFVTAADGFVPSGTLGYGLFGLETTGAMQSRYLSVGADGCMLYVQSVVTYNKAEDTVPMNFDVSDAGLLGPDNTLIVKMAVFLNTTGLALHMEPSWVMKYRFEPATP